MLPGKPDVTSGPSKRTADRKHASAIVREWVFGLRTEVTDSVQHLNDSTVIYPAGAALIIHNAATNPPRQSFVPLNDESRPVALAISHQRDLFVICFAGEMASVELWNTETMLCEKVLGSQDLVSTSFVSASFSAGNKMLVAQGGPPDWTMVLFLIEKGKVFSVLRLTDTQEFGSVKSVAFHPSDVNVISVTGDRILRLLKLHDKLLKPWGYVGGHEHSCTSQVWFDDHILLVGTSDASVLILEDGEHQTTINVSHPDFTRKKGTSVDDGGPGAIEHRLPWHVNVSAIKGFDGGFLCACGPDKIFLFQKSDNIHEYFSQLLVMRVCEPSPAARVSGKGEHTITCLSLSPSQSDIVVASHSGQLFRNKLPSLVDFQLQTLVFSPLGSLCHEGSIVDVDTCIWKPIAVTVSSDKTLRTWDLEQHKLMFQYTFKEQIYSLALHPTGLHVAVGLTDALHIFHLLFETVRRYKELKIRRCSLCKFSWGGQCLAAVDGNLLILCSSIFLKRSATLKGHTSKITGIAWLPDDSSLVSCSADGGVFGWDLQTNSVTWEIRLNECQFLCSGMIVVEQEGPTIISGCSTMIYHMNTGQMVEEGPFAHGSATCVNFCPAKNIVICGTVEGHIVLFDFPSITASPPIKVGGHASAVTKINVTADEERLISCGADGIVIIWALTKKVEDDPAHRINKEKIGFLPRIPEMLVAQQDIEKMLSHITALESHVQYMKKDKIHHLSLEEKKFLNQLTEMKTSHDTTQAELKKKIWELERIHREDKLLTEVEIANLRAEQEASREKLIQESRQKLMYEYSKQDKLQIKLDELKAQMKSDQEEWEEASKRELEEQLNQQKSTVQNLTHQLQKTLAELETERQEDAQLLRLVEASAEVELGHIQASLHTQLAEEQKKTSALREQRAALQRKIVTLEKEKELSDSMNRLMKEEKKQLVEENATLQKNLTSLRKEIRHRNEIIAQREEEIANYRETVEQKKKRELLQEHEINRLKSILKPAEEIIHDKGTEIQQIEEQLNNARLQVEARERQAKQLSQRLTTAQGMNSKHQRDIHTEHTRLIRLQSDIANASRVIHHPKKLKDAFKSLVEKHLPKGTAGEIWTRTFLSADAEVQEKALEETSGDEATYQELLRQRHVLEEALGTLKAKDRKDRQAYKSRMTSLIKENRQLLNQVEELEKKLEDLEAERKFPSKNRGPGEARNSSGKYEKQSAKQHQICFTVNTNLDPD